MMGMKESRYNIWLERKDSFYVFNGTSGAVLSLSKEQYNEMKALLAEENGTVPLPRFFLNLVKERVLVMNDEDEVKTLRRRYFNNQADNTHFALAIVTSLGCNFNCPYCYESKYHSLIRSDVQGAIITLLENQLSKIKEFTVRWFGGEPLLGKKSLLSLSDTFIRLCDQAGVSYDADIYTNGYLLDEPTCKQLKDRRVSKVQITLDGPPEIHDRMRPLASGRGTFNIIVGNLKHAVNYFDIGIRVNVDADNNRYVKNLMDLLRVEGLSGKLTIYPGQLINADYGIATPSAAYESKCFSIKQFASFELEFNRLAVEYGFASETLPRTISTPCTAVRTNELIVGSEGEIYKCFHTVGNELEVIGNIRDYKSTNERLYKWINYDPFTNNECVDCVALPGCMGGCAYHAMHETLYENRCSTFRYSYRKQMERYIRGQQKVRVPSDPIQITRTKN